MKCPVSVLILTWNEEVNIAQCLSSVLGWADQVSVVDSFSTDQTVAIAKEMGAEVYQRKFDGYAAQKNWALDNLPLRNEWLLILDADEYIGPDLRTEIADTIAADGNGFHGFWINLRVIFYGKWIRHCGWYPSWKLRLFRHKSGRYEIRPVDEHVMVTGRTGKLKNDFYHRDCHDMDWWIAKHNRYATLSAIAYQHAKAGKWKDSRLRPRIFGSQAERRRFLKENVWRHLPLKPLLFFTYMYFFRLGFLDGGKGFMFCAMHAAFQQMKAAKEWEIEERHNLTPVISQIQPELQPESLHKASATLESGAR